MLKYYPGVPLCLFVPKDHRCVKCGGEGLCTLTYGKEKRYEKNDE